MDWQLTGKRALVSGSTAGIGFAIAEALAKEGAQVVVNGRTEERVREALDKLKSSGFEAGGRGASRGWRRRQGDRLSNSSLVSPAVPTTTSGIAPFVPGTSPSHPAGPARRRANWN
ncbi:MAG TPA: SDR family NAD(P)-dependent oxidoreductase [Bryobacteraceae bacterium]